MSQQNHPVKGTRLHAIVFQAGEEEDIALEKGISGCPWCP
jgi:hypothetical protein